MRKTIRCICGILAICLLLCACQSDSGSPSSTNPTAKPVKPTTRPVQTPPVMQDPNRALPTLAPKYVTDTPAAGDLILAQNGVAKATIVYPDKNSKATSAANDLENYLERITGADFAKVSDAAELPAGSLILVGPTKKTAELGVEPIHGYPESEKYLIRRVGEHLILTGNDDRTYKGSQNAVTRFLEEAGCGWFANDALWQVVPQKATLAVKDWNQTFTPRFATRTLTNLSGVLSSRWYTGGDRNLTNHYLKGMVPMHNYTSHPEWFALYNGERDPRMCEYWQYCYTNEGLIKEVARVIVGQLTNDPSRVNGSVAANDGWNDGWCECEQCTAVGSRTDQMIYFANHVAEIVCEYFPDATISFLAYHATFLPPVSNIKAHPNVEVMFCLENSPMADFSSDYIIHYGTNGITQVTYTQSWKDSVQTFVDKANLQHLSIWGWYCISAEDENWEYVPWVQGNVITRNLAQFEKMGAYHVFLDCSGSEWDLRWPLFYPAARGMWDDAPDAEAMLYDACLKLYGAAADEMFIYYRTLADCSEVCVDSTGITWKAPSVMSVYCEYLSMVQEKADSVKAKLDQLTPEQKSRVEGQLRYWNIAMYICTQ